MKVNDAPVFMKSVCALLILTSVAELLVIFITVLNSKYVRSQEVNLVLFLLIQSIFCFAMVWMVYGLIIKLKWYYVCWIIMAAINIVWLIFNINNGVKYVLSALLLIEILLLTALPRVRRYCLGKDVSSFE